MLAIVAFARAVKARHKAHKAQERQRATGSGAPLHDWLHGRGRSRGGWSNQRER
jgi:hypothetical protein